MSTKPTDSTEEITQESVSIKECTVHSVVVYKDRAEVCRNFKTNASAGDHEVIFTNLSSSLDSESIRIEGYGEAVINEVAFKEEFKNLKEEDKDKKVADLEKKLKLLHQELSSVKLSQERVKSQKAALNSFLTEYVKRPDGKAGNAEDNSSLCNKFGKNLADDMSSFLNTYSNNSATLDKEYIELTEKEKDLQKEIDCIPPEIQKLHSGQVNITRQVSVLLTAKKAGDIELRISYLAHGASWSPRYDVRVYSAEKAMKISYYGIVQQSTGEDWDNAKLLLSTASPSVGGTLPDLGILRVDFRHPLPPPPRAMAARYMGAELCSEPAPFAMASESFMDAPMAEIVSEVSSGMTNTTFEIVRESSVPSDGVGHKVTVGLIELKPEFSYEAVPKKSAYAYLRAVAKNSSNYVLLKGPSNVFLDNNFICKSEISDVFPGEEFRSWLGIDAAVKLTYEPASRFTQAQGLINKSVLTTTKQVIRVKNNHDFEVLLTVKDHVPQTLNQKIKVNLSEPAFNKTHKGEWLQLKPQTIKVSETEHGLVLWKLNLAAGASENVSLVYSVELPKGETADYVEQPLPDDSISSTNLRF